MKIWFQLRRPPTSGAQSTTGDPYERGLVPALASGSQQVHFS